MIQNCLSQGTRLPRSWGHGPVGGPPLPLIVSSENHVECSPKSWPRATTMLGQYRDTIASLEAFERQVACWSREHLHMLIPNTWIQMGQSMVGTVETFFEETSWVAGRLCCHSLLCFHCTLHNKSSTFYIAISQELFIFGISNWFQVYPFYTILWNPEDMIRSYESVWFAVHLSRRPSYAVM
jgi:hypothetical protein